MSAQAPDTTVKAVPKLWHWFFVSYYDSSDFSVNTAVYKSENKDLKMSNLKEIGSLTRNSTLLSLSYLGLMTKKEFEGEDLTTSEEKGVK